jgi:ankyrin repeat protein
VRLIGLNMPDKYVTKDFLGLSNAAYATFIFNPQLLSKVFSDDYIANAGVNEPIEGLGNRTALHLASNAADHRLEMVKTLLAHGADLSLVDSKGRTPIFYAANCGDSELLKFYFQITSQQAFKDKDLDGRNLVHALCLSGTYKASAKERTASLQQILDVITNKDEAQIYALLTAKDNHHITPIMYAKHNNYTFLLEIFKKYGIDIDKIPEIPANKFQLCDVFGRNACIRALDLSLFLREEIDITQLEDLNPIEPIEQYRNANVVQWAAMVGYAGEILIRLIKLSDHRFDPHAQDAKGNTILHYATYYHNPDQLSRLLNYLYYLTKTRTLSALDKLLDQRNHDSRTALHTLVMNQMRLAYIPDTTLSRDSIHQLIFYGIDRNIRDNNGQTAADLAARHEFADLARFIDSYNDRPPYHIIDNPRQPDKYVTKDFLGLSLVALDTHLCLVDKLAFDLSIVRYMASCGVNEPVAGFGSRTPLHLASNAADHRLAMAKTLLAHGADLSVVDSKGRTPVFYAANCGDLELLKLYFNTFQQAFTKDLNGRNLVHALCLSGTYKTSAQELNASLQQILDTATNKDKAQIYALLTAEDNYHITPIMYAKHNNYTFLLETFKKYGINIDEIPEIPANKSRLCDVFGRNAFIQALDQRVFLNKEEIDFDVAKLKDLNPMEPIEQYRKANAIHWAFLAGYPQVFELLRNLRVDLLAQDAHGNTALHYATYYRSFEKMSAALAYFQKFQVLDKLINHRNKDGRTALHTFAMFSIPHNLISDDPKVIKELESIIGLLIDYGANRLIEDNDHQTSADLAAKHEFIEIAHFIDNYKSPSLDQKHAKREEPINCCSWVYNMFCCQNVAVISSLEKLSAIAPQPQASSPQMKI